MFASRLHPLCCLAKAEIKSDFKHVFYSYIKILSIQGLVIILQFSHWFIIHDDETVISCFMSRHQMLKFSYSFKA